MFLTSCHLWIVIIATAAVRFSPFLFMQMILTILLPYELRMGYPILYGVIEGGTSDCKGWLFLGFVFIPYVLFFAYAVITWAVNIIAWYSPIFLCGLEWCIWSVINTIPLFPWLVKNVLTPLFPVLSWVINNIMIPVFIQKAVSHLWPHVRRWFIHKALPLGWIDSRIAYNEYTIEQIVEKMRNLKENTKNQTEDMKYCNQLVKDMADHRVKEAHEHYQKESKADKEAILALKKRLEEAERRCSANDIESKKEKALLISNINELNAHIQALKGQIQADKVEYANQEGIVNQMIESLTQAINSIEAETNSFTKMFRVRSKAAMQVDLAMVINNVHNFKKDIGSITQNMNELYFKIHQHEKRIKEQETQIEKLKKETTVPETPKSTLTPEEKNLIRFFLYPFPELQDTLKKMDPEATFTEFLGEIASHFVFTVMDSENALKNMFMEFKRTNDVILGMASYFKIKGGNKNAIANLLLRKFHTDHSYNESSFIQKFRERLFKLTRESQMLMRRQ